MVRENRFAGAIDDSPLVVKILAWPELVKDNAMTPCRDFTRGARLLHSSGGAGALTGPLFLSLFSRADNMDDTFPGEKSDVESLRLQLSEVMQERDYYRRIAEQGGEKSLGDVHDLSEIVKDLRQTQDALHRSQEELEMRVAERTAELVRLNRDLANEIAERMQVEEKLRVSKMRYQTLLENSSDWVWEVDENGRYTYASPQVREILGFDPADIIGKTPFDLMSEEEKESVAAIFHDAVSNRRPFSALENRNVHRDGHVVVLETNGVPFFDESGTFRGYRGMDRDISGRKCAEEERQKVQKLESIGILAGGIAHDFNNLLMVIIGNISLARKKSGEENAIDDLLGKAEQASFRAKALTQQLLTFARGGEPVKKTVSVEPLLADSAIFSLSGSNVTYEINCAVDLWPVEIDEGQVSHALNNIFINSRQAMPEGGIIRIDAVNLPIGPDADSSLPAGDYVRIRIEDHGAGIPEEYIGRIFDPYFTTKGKGSGLGLAITHSIIRKHNGHLSVESAPGVGTTVLIHLPAHGGLSLPAEAAGVEYVEGRGRVLVMDDEPMLREIAGELLREVGYEREYARDGAEAVRIYRQAMESGRPFDAVILDLTVPGGMGGEEAIKKLLEIDPDARVIVSSGYSEHPIMANFRDYGFRAVISKPYRLDELSKVLHELIMGPL
jgi:two-component system, cell cycle sensor histidine kinase and response regulator CckA